MNLENKIIMEATEVDEEQIEEIKKHIKTS